MGKGRAASYAVGVVLGIISLILFVGALSQSQIFGPFGIGGSVTAVLAIMLFGLGKQMQD